jgi:hypothetical protein
MTMGTSTPRRPGRVIPWLAHHDPALMIVSGVILFLPLGDDLIGSITVYVGAAVFALAVSASVVHSYSYLCLRCAEKTPLDGVAEAQRRHRSITVLHAISEGRRGRVIAWASLALFFFNGLLKLFIDPRPWGSIFPMLAYAFWTAHSFLYLRHLPVQPWCPHCHWDDGGDEEESPIIPDPVAPEGVHS